jgi:MarR family 2-MHQ and catechol resistance regulon transcriptional repressor
MGTHCKGIPQEIRALDCYIKLSRAADSAMAKVCRRLAGVRLTGTQFGTLEALDHLGPLSIGQIAAKLLSPRQSNNGSG